MAEIRKTSDPSDRGASKFVRLYLLKDAALNVRNRRHANDVADTRKQRTERGDALLRLGVAHCTGTAPMDWKIGRSPVGRPTVEQGQVAKDDLRLSLSHSGEYIVAGICNATTIGVDIERQVKRRFTQIARHLDWPRGTWDPPNTLQASGFYHLWTLWEAAIKCCSADSGVLSKSVFNLIIAELTAGTPTTTLTQGWLASSWQCPNHFWLSIITAFSEVPEIQLFLVNGLKSAKQAPQISQMANDSGFLNPERLRQEHAESI